MFNIMSRGRLARLLILVTLASGLMMSVTQSVHAQSANPFRLSGTLTDADGAGLEGYTVEAPIDVSFLASASRTDVQGNYSILYSGFEPVVSVGDTIEITVKDPDGQVVGTSSYTVTETDINRVGIAEATHNIQLSGLSVELDVVQLPADGVSTVTITVSVKSGGQAVTDDTLEITAESGSVGEVTSSGDGTYTAVYTAPALVLTESMTDTITVSSDTTGDTTTESVSLEAVPTVIAVSVSPNVFDAGGEATGAVQITANRGPNMVADADLSLNLIRADGGADTGSVSGVTNNADGTYSATYTPASAAGQIDLSATDAVSGASGTAAVTVNAGPAATISVSAAPMTVSSGESAVITAAVADESGNGVGGIDVERLGG